MASNAPRQLVQSASAAAPSQAWARPSACRLLPRTSCRRLLSSRAPRQGVAPKMIPTPQAPPPKSSSPQSIYAQKAQERALLSKLSTLSPEQITDLLSNRPGVGVGVGVGALDPPAQPPPAAPTYLADGGSPGPGKTATTRWRWVTPVLFALSAAFIGNQVGDAVVSTTLLSYLSDFEEARAYEDEDEVFIETAQLRTRMVLTSLTHQWSPLEMQTIMGLPCSGLFNIQPAGYLSYRYYGAMKPAFAMIRGVPTLIEQGTLTASDDVDSDFGDPATMVSWPAHMHLLNRLQTTGPLAERRRHHLVAGTYGSVQTLGGLYQVVRDPDTDELSVLVLFGSRMCGMVSIAHPGAVATVLDESMGRLAARVLPANTAVTAKLYLNAHAPNTRVNDVCRIKLDVMTKEAAARFESVLRLEAATKLVPLHEMTLERVAPPGEDVVDHPRDSRGPLIPANNTDVPPPQTTKLKEVQTDRKVWIRARMYSARENVLLYEAKGLFVVPKDGELAPLGNEW